MPGRGRGRPPHPDVLTPTEWAVLDQWRHGLSRTELADRRGISRHAVRYHLRNIADKLAVASSADLRHWRGAPVTSAMRRQGSSPSSRAERSSVMSSPATSSQPGSAGEVGGSRALALGALGQVSLYVRDAASSESWYRDVLGLPEVFRFGDLVFFDCGGVRLYLHAVAAEQWRPGSVLYFLVPDIEVAHAELVARGVRVTGAPHLVFRDDASGIEEWMAFFEDPDGNLLALMARVAPPG